MVSGDVQKLRDFLVARSGSPVLSRRVRGSIARKFRQPLPLLSYRLRMSFPGLGVAECFDAEKGNTDLAGDVYGMLKGSGH